MLEKPWKDRSVGRYNTNEVKTSLTCSTIRETMLFIKQLYYNTLKTRTQRGFNFSASNQSRRVVADADWLRLTENLSLEAAIPLMQPYSPPMDTL